jgi:hypothetical protein
MQAIAADKSTANSLRMSHPSYPNMTIYRSPNTPPWR